MKTTQELSEKTHRAIRETVNRREGTEKPQTAWANGPAHFQAQENMKTSILEQMATVEGHVSIADGVAHLPDGTAIRLNTAEWYCRPPSKYGQSVVIDEKTGDNIAVVYDGQSHADLLSAAPDLLACVRELILQPTWHRNLAPYERAALDRARAAIAKAEGKQ